MIIEHAIAIAAEAHMGQVRKGKGLPYIVHPIQVAALVAKHGGSAVEVAAALLHDVIEDCGRKWRVNIAINCGLEVLDIVLACSDCDPVEGQAKAPWLERKNAYIEGVKHKSASAMLVTACDKLANAQEIVADLNLGHNAMSHFSVDRDLVIWYYDRMALELLEHGTGQVKIIAHELANLVVAMDALSA